jgi:phosphoglycolate phosphatase
MSKSVDLLIFDFDGTLADSLPAAIKSVQQMLQELGLPHKSAPEIGQYIGFGEWALVAGAIGSEKEDEVKQAQALYYKHNFENIKEVPLYPHIQELIGFFKDKMKIIISNKRDEFIRLILQRHKLDHYFREILGGDSAPCLKPDPCAILHVLEKYKVMASRALFVGDMTVDIETGKNANVLTCAVTYGFHSRTDLEKLQPDFLIDDILELKELVD